MTAPRRADYEIAKVAAHLEPQDEHRDLPGGVGLVIADGGVPRDHLGHSSARAVTSSSSASTVNVSAPTSTVISGWALRL